MKMGGTVTGGGGREWGGVGRDGVDKGVGRQMDRGWEVGTGVVVGEGWGPGFSGSFWLMLSHSVVVGRRWG